MLPIEPPCLTRLWSNQTSRNDEAQKNCYQNKLRRIMIVIQRRYVSSTHLRQRKNIRSENCHYRQLLMYVRNMCQHTQLTFILIHFCWSYKKKVWGDIFMKVCLYIKMSYYFFVEFYRVEGRWGSPSRTYSDCCRSIFFGDSMKRVCNVQHKSLLEKCGNVYGRKMSYLFCP